MRRIWEFHDWYDTLPEGQRFLYLLIGIIPLSTAANVANGKHQTGWALLFLSLLIMVCLNRMYWLEIIKKRRDS